MLSVPQTVLNTIRRKNLFSSGDTVYVAVSGGADSVTLLHILCELKEELCLQSVRALHVNHGLRGANADRDEAFVRELCYKLQIPLEVEKADVPAVVRETRKSVEEAARDVRYAFFKRVTDGVGDAKIATAHTADDRAETVLMHLARGCGLHGLIGIPYHRDNIVRPLLDCTALQVRNYAAEKNMAYVYDETNADETYTRNFIRHRVLPAFQQVNPTAVTAILRLSDMVAADDEYLQNAAKTVLENAKTEDFAYSCTPIADAADPVATRALVNACMNVSGVHPEQRHIEQLLHSVRYTGAVTLPGDWVARSDGQTLRFQRAVRTPPSDTMESSCTVLPLDKEAVFLNQRYTATILHTNDFSDPKKIHKKLLDSGMDYDMIVGSFYLRTRREGDSFRPYKRHCTKTLKQFFQEQRIPADQRDFVPLLCDEQGILAVLGYAVDERVAVREDTQHILLVKPHSEGSR